MSSKNLLRVIKGNFIIFGILILAAFLRLYKIADYMTFLGDEGRDVLVVYNILHGKLTFLGPTASVGGFFLGPIYYYFMAPFLWISNYNPVGPAVMVALFGIITVWLVYKIGREFFDKKTGLIAAGLYAISPIVIAYSRSSWNPNLIPFFSILTLYFVYKAAKDKSWKFFILSGILFGILMQLHYLSTFLGVVIASYLIFVNLFLFEKIQSKILETLKEYLYFFFGFIVGWSPFLFFEVRHGFPNIGSILRFIFSSSDTGGNAKFFQIVKDVFFRLFGRLITSFPPPEQISVQVSTIKFDLYFKIIEIPIFYLYYFTLFLAFSGLLVFFFKFYKSFKQKDNNFYKLSLILFWFSFGILLFGFYKKSIYDYYFGFMFPISFLLVGSFISFLISNKVLGKIVGGIILVVLIGLNLSGIPFRSTPNRQLAQVEQISKFVSDKTDGKPFNFALITGGNSDHAYRYFFTTWNHAPVTIENVLADPQRKTVTDQLLIVCESNHCAPLGNSLWEVAGFGRAEVVGEWNVSVVKVYRLVHYKPQK